MKVSHEEYLKRTMKTKQMELDALNVNHRIAIAVYDSQKLLMQKEIDSIESQLSNGKVN